MTEPEHLRRELQGLERRGSGGNRRAAYLRARIGQLEPSRRGGRQPGEPRVERRRVLLLLLDRDWAALEDGYEALTAYQQQVLDLRYGLRPGSPTAMNVGDVAAALGKSARSIESAEQRAITRLCERAAG